MLFLKLSWDLSRLLVLVSGGMCCVPGVFTIVHSLDPRKRCSRFCFLFPLNGFGLAKKHNEAFIFD